MAIDNLPSLLSRESSEDYAAQLLLSLLGLHDLAGGVCAGAQDAFRAGGAGAAGWKGPDPGMTGLRQAGCGPSDCETALTIPMLFVNYRDTA
ncbi:hypothetical protein [Roseicitreum antarcticum]|uniref:Uncharacterized protein n=1 Tax=Roseicitreum antarcticum TaxID=564137 RepID=A0A1H2SAZ5_9RHOB|nr:hypothetical protein [Roseicitreum antarcticum]SDW28831.1 hypothetical protein SAMN04488238_101555 [Roseicitreum antarcticum]